MKVKGTRFWGSMPAEVLMAGLLCACAQGGPLAELEGHAGVVELLERFGGK